MPIRIMHVVDTWALGGLQNGLANLIERMDQDRFEHVVCAMRPVDESNAQRIPAGCTRVIGLSPEEAAARFQIPALIRRIREANPDIVHTRNWGTFEAQLAARRVGGCARVHSEHGIDWDTTTKEPLRRLLCRRLAFHLANRVLSVSAQLRDLHARRTGFPANRIEVIHNGVDSRRFRPDITARARIRRELGIAEDEFCIACVGNLIPVKDHLTLLRALEVFARSVRPWRLLIVGDGPERDNLTEFVNSKAALKFRGSSARKSRSSGKSAFRFGGSWNRTGPSCSASGCRLIRKRRIGSSTFFSRRMWVMYWLAFSAKRKSGPTSALQLVAVFSARRLRKVKLTSTAGSCVA